VNFEALGRAGLVSGAELVADLGILLVVYLNPRSPAGQVTPPRRVGALRPVGVIAAAHVAQWSGIAVAAALGLEPRSAVSYAAFAAAWLGGLVVGLALLRRLLQTHCAMDAASSREMAIGKLAVHGVVWLCVCIYADVMI
jgi:hypothetical protein